MPAAGPVSDLNHDAVVGITDLLVLIGYWGATHGSADVDGDGTVNINDIIILLDN